MTSHQRLLALLRGDAVDRVGVHLVGVRPWTDWWMAKRNDTYAPLIEAVRRQADCLTPIGFEGGFLHSGAPVDVDVRVETPPAHADVEHHVTTVRGPTGLLRQVHAVNKSDGLVMPLEHFIKTPADVENLLALPYEPLRPDIAPMIELHGRVGQRGLVMIGIGSDPVGDVHGLLGSERMAFWSFEHRDLIRCLLGEFLRRKLDIVKHFAASGLGRHMPLVFGHVGAEAVVPPLHGPADFRDFCARYDRPLHDLIHEVGGYVRCHCHGRIDLLLEDFVEMGVDMLQPVEAPPMGDVVLEDGLRRVGDRMTLEGNVEFSKIIEEEEPAFRRRIEEVVAVGKAGGRFCLCPTSSPYEVDLPPRMLANYLTMLDVVEEQG